MSALVATAKEKTEWQCQMPQVNRVRKAWLPTAFLAFQILDRQEIKTWLRSVCRYRACFTSHELGMGRWREECCRAADCLLSEDFLLGRILSCPFRAVLELLRAAEACRGAADGAESTAWYFSVQPPVTALSNAHQRWVPRLLEWLKAKQEVCF